MPCLDGAEPVDRAGLEEHRLDQRRLSRPAVTDDGDVADLSGLGGHRGRLLLGTRGHGSRSYPWRHLSSAPRMWWQEAVVYQIYPRSFQDSDGDGVGDLPRDHAAARSPRLARRRRVLAFADLPLAARGLRLRRLRLHRGSTRSFGTLDDFDELVAAAHERGLRVLLDLVACHTSIEHPWFREHPDWYIWSPVDGPPNNWVSAFGGPAWSRDERDRPLVPALVLSRAAGPRLAQPGGRRRRCRTSSASGSSAAWTGSGSTRSTGSSRTTQLRDDPPASGPFPLPLHPEDAPARAALLRQPARGDRGAARRCARPRATRCWSARSTGRPSEYARYLEVLDLVFAFEFLLLALGRANALRAAIEPAAELRRVAWVMSNHDFDRLATRVGPENLRAAAVLLLTLPGVAFVYQGDELGLANGPGRRAALRPCRARPAAPPDAVGRVRRRFHHRRALAAARRPRRAERRRRSAATQARCSTSTAA